MAPGLTLAQSLRLDFSDPGCRQLFGRYATYVGGSPYLSPAILGLIWHSEARGVWAVDGGMHNLAAPCIDWRRRAARVSALGRRPSTSKRRANMRRRAARRRNATQGRYRPVQRRSEGLFDGLLG
jgi:hypothetical protein